MNLDEDNDNDDNEENSSYKRKYAELEDGIDNFDDYEPWKKSAEYRKIESEVTT